IRHRRIADQKDLHAPRITFHFPHAELFRQPVGHLILVFGRETFPVRQPVPWTSRNGGSPARTWLIGEASRSSCNVASSAFASVRPNSPRIEVLRPPRRSMSATKSTGA